MGMTINEICYRLQAMATMCIFQDAVGHDLSHKEIGLYNQAKDEAVKIIKRYQMMQANHKADMLAMLTELQAEIEEVAKCSYEQCIGAECSWQDCMIHKGRVVGLLQEKIDKLKG